MSLSSIRDQDIPLRFLQRLVERDRVPHGLLFFGPSGVGKTFAAREFIKTLYCKEVALDNCGKCLACRKVDHGNHADIVTVSPLKKSRVIDVEAIDRVNEMASLRPLEAPRRVFLLLDAERMNASAQNHLLKTLEEPPGNSLFILVTEFPGLMLPTIRSRCQRVRFGTLKTETIVELLQQQTDLSREVVQSLAALAQGQMSRALDLAHSGRRDVVLEFTGRLEAGEDPLEMAEEFAQLLAAQRAQFETVVIADTTPEDTRGMSPQDVARIKEEQLAVIDALARQDTMEYLYLLETWYRDVLVYHAAGGDYVLNQDQAARLKAARAETAEGKIGAIEKARLYLERFLNEERVLRDLFFVLAD